MRSFLLRGTLTLIVVMLGGACLALVVGRFMPAEMLTVSAVSYVQFEQDDYFVLVDLNRHLRVRVAPPFDPGLGSVYIFPNGQEALILRQGSEGGIYRFNLMDGSYRQYARAYTYPDTGRLFLIDVIYRLSDNNRYLWDIDSNTGTVFRLDLENGDLQPIVSVIDPNAERQRLDIDASLNFSPDSAQITIVESETVYVFNADGSDLRRYPNPIANASASFGYVMPNERYIFVGGYNNLTSNFYSEYRYLDANTGEVNPFSADLHGYSMAPCWEDSQWVAYVDLEARGQVLNIETGETHDLMSAAELNQQPFASLSWISNCEWLFVRIGTPNNMLTAMQHQPMYIISRDGQIVIPLGQQVALLSTIAENTYLLAEANGATSTVYEVHFDSGAVQRTAIGSITLSGTWMNPLQSDPYRLLVHDWSQSYYTSLLDVRTGVYQTYFTPEESVGSPVQWRWD